MNEQIEELLGQAYDEAVPETWTTLSSEQLGRIYEKFAELLIKKCIDAVGDGPLERPAVQRIKAAFGVEYYKSIEKAFEK